VTVPLASAILYVARPTILSFCHLNPTFSLPSFLIFTHHGVGTFTNPSGFLDIAQPQSMAVKDCTFGDGHAVATTVTELDDCAPQPTIGGNQTVQLAWSVADPSSTGVSVVIQGIGTFGALTIVVVGGENTWNIASDPSDSASRDAAHGQILNVKAGSRSINAHDRFCSPHTLTPCARIDGRMLRLR